MGNKRNRAPRRKRRFPNCYLKWKDDKPHTTIQTQNDIVSTDETGERTVVVDVVSILNSVADVQHNTPPTTVNSIQGVQEPVYDPLLVIKSEEKTQLMSDELPSVDYSRDTQAITSVAPIISKLEIEPIVKIEADVSEPSTSIGFKNMCRLCLAKDEARLIDIFANKSYVDCKEITPSNITEIVEQCTAVKISQNDHLPNQLCKQCFLSIRFFHQFKQKSIKSQISLSEMVKASNELLYKENELKEPIVNAVNSKPANRLVKIVRLKPLPKTFFKAKQNLTNHRPATVIPLPKTTDVAIEEEEKNTGDVQCELCGKIFERSKLLQYHMNRHNDVKPFACTEPFCDKTFFSPMNRKNHIRTVHCTDPPHKCDLCEKAYTKLEKLKNHRSIHFPPTIPCTICGKLLRSQSSVYKHRKSHTERMYPCDDCGKSFQNAYTLRVHRRIHTNEKPFVCSKCGETFAHNCLLKAHDERKHSD